MLLIEGEEESGSTSFMHYIEKLQERIGSPHLLICTDSGTGNYDTFWNTTTLRGNLKAQLNVKTLETEFHSGMSAGFVPSSFMIIRSLLDRLENSETGEIHPAF